MRSNVFFVVGDLWKGGKPRTYVFLYCNDELVGDWSLDDPVPEEFQKYIDMLPDEERRKLFELMEKKKPQQQEQRRGQITLDSFLRRDGE